MRAILLCLVGFWVPALDRALPPVPRTSGEELAGEAVEVVETWICAICVDPPLFRLAAFKCCADYVYPAIGM